MFLTIIGPFQSSVGVATDGSGNVYVADSYNARIQKFDNSGTFLMTFGWGVADGKAAFEICSSACHAGIPGSGNGQFYYPSGVAVDGSGNIYVADSDNFRIQKFDASGTFLTTWGSQGPGNGQFVGRYGIATEGSGNVYVADSGNGRIQKFDASGTFLTAWGAGTAYGQLSSPLAWRPMAAATSTSRTATPTAS
jgi:DNA-binding beta-propeller fold protein YncE